MPDLYRRKAGETVEAECLTPDNLRDVRAWVAARHGDAECRAWSDPVFGVEVRWRPVGDFVQIARAGDWVVRVDSAFRKIPPDIFARDYEPVPDAKPEPFKSAAERVAERAYQQAMEDYFSHLDGLLCLWRRPDPDYTRGVVTAEGIYE